MELLPCPHCAGQQLDLMEDEIAGIRRRWIGCQGCGGTGPWAATAGEARRLWNQRQLNAVVLDACVRDLSRRRLATRQKRVSVTFQE